MEWVPILVSVAVVWFASLCKILHASFYPHQSSFLNNNAGSIQKKNVLLVIAHPDDESMFFSPTINHLTSRGHNVHILCMSTGNADGIGDVRKEELYKASAILKVPLQQVTALDHPDFQDGFGKVWSSSKLSKIVEKKILAHSIDMIITFDKYGVSGHCNHRDVRLGVQRFMLDTSKQEIEAWELVSTNIVRKYSGPIDIWLSFWTANNSVNGEMHCLLNEHPRRSYVAMSQHLSQWVWCCLIKPNQLVVNDSTLNGTDNVEFLNCLKTILHAECYQFRGLRPLNGSMQRFRKLFVSFSSYTYVNTLRKINK